MIQEAIIKRVMKLRESEIKFDLQQGAIFQEFFNHPNYLRLDETAQIELGLYWARDLYQRETDNPSIEAFFVDVDLREYCRDAIMLDLGCYVGGKTVKWLERYEGTEIHGIDIDSRFIKVATCFAQEKCANAHFSVSYAEELGFPDGFFDIVLSENTLEHVTDIGRVMRECKRVLKKDGLMVVIFPSFWGPFSHHLDLVTRTPFIHWFFKYPVLLRAYFTILDERGEEALWYRRQDEHPLLFERGYSINGTGAMEFSELVQQDWEIIADGFKKRTRSSNVVRSALSNCIKGIRLPFLRELFPIAYILKKR